MGYGGGGGVEGEMVRSRLGLFTIFTGTEKGEPHE